ncbi:MAG TPA: C13 family peptidase [Rhizomicrobium sp.]
MGGWLQSWIRRSTGKDDESTTTLEPLPQDAWSQTGRSLRVIAVGVIGFMLLAGASWYALSHRHYNWAVVVVAGDWHAHDGGPSEAFDNSRRDVSAELRQIGFNDAYMMQFSVRPDLDATTHPMPSTADGISQELSLLTSETPDGCIVYFSSHGAPQGMILGNTLLTPNKLAGIVDGTCGNRPTVVIISACFSGVFVPALEGDNRMVLTAARADRTSFGCTQDARYPYFDTCVVQDLPGAHDFPDLADKVKACVEKREQDTGVSPPSEPQISIGSRVADNLPTW